MKAICNIHSGILQYLYERKKKKTNELMHLFVLIIDQIIRPYKPAVP